MGWLKIAFNYSFYYLKYSDDYTTNENIYRELMEKILIFGGDTDTNAAIVGGLIGALVGYSGLPPAFVDKVMSFEVTLPNGTMNTNNPVESYRVPKYHLSHLID
jgi:ADP-ribosyl-[dinitrogen reductase] hydrolase